MTIKRLAQIPFRDRTSSTVVSGIPTIVRVDTWQVVASDQTALGTDIIFATGTDGHGNSTTLPRANDLLVLTNGTTFYCSSVVPQRMSDPLEWEAEVTWTELTFSGQTGKWNIQISCDAVGSSENSSFYADGTLITNSAGDVYPEGLPKEYYDRKYVISFNTDSVEADELDGIVGKINSDTVTFTVNGITKTFPPQTLKCPNAPWKTTYNSADGTSHQFAVSLELLYRSVMINGNEVGWASPVVDKGYRQIDDDGNVIINAQGQPCDSDGNAISTPIFLDGNGQQLDTSSGATASVFYPSTPNTIPDSAEFSPALSGI